MELSENDRRVFDTASTGDVVILDSGEVVRVTERIGQNVWLRVMECQAFHHCEGMASLIMDHPILGRVPACESCKGILS